MALATIRPQAARPAERARSDGRSERLEAMTAHAGWEGPLSKAVSAEAWRKARELATAVRAEVGASEEPFVSPGTDGSIGLRWAAPGRTLSVELAADGVFFCETHGGDVADEGETEARDVIGLVRRLYR